MDAQDILNPPDVIAVPVEFKKQFVNISAARRALRDVMAYPGIQFSNPINVGMIKQCQRSKYHNPYNSQLMKFEDLRCNHTAPLYGHFDLGKVDDPFAFCFCHVDNFVKILNEVYPLIIIDFIGRIKPSKIRSVELGTAIDIISEIVTVGYDINLVTSDHWQSMRVLEEIHHQFPGIIAAPVSVDRPQNYIKIDYEKKDRFERVSLGGNLLFYYETLQMLLEKSVVRCPVFPILDREVQCLQVDDKGDSMRIIKVATPDGFNNDDTIQCLVSSITHCYMNEKNNFQNYEFGKNEEEEDKKNEILDNFEMLLQSIHTSGKLNEQLNKEKESFFGEEPLGDNIHSDKYW